MASWLPVLLLVVAVLGIGLLRERWRVTRIEQWARRAGFAVRTPFSPPASPPMAALAARFQERGARVWGLGLDGTVDGVPVTIAEHEVTSSGTRATGVWHTLVVWPLGTTASPASAPPEAPAIAGWPHDGELRSDEGYGAWRMPGTVSASRLDAVLSHLSEARRRLG